MGDYLGIISVACVLIKSKASYSLRGRSLTDRKISWNLEATKLGVIMIVSLKFDAHLGSAAVEVPVKFQSDCKSLNPNLVASRLHEILP